MEKPRPPRKASPLSVHCPQCSARFKLRNRQLLGRRVSCPECGGGFTIRAEAEPVVEAAVWEETGGDADLAALDNFDDMGEVVAVERSHPADGYEDYDPPAPAWPGPHRRLSGRWMALVGGGLLAVIGLVLLTVFVQRSASSSPAMESQLAYLPADCRAVGFYRMGDVARNPFFQDHLTRSIELRTLADQFRNRTGMELKELESVVIGLKNEEPSAFHSLAVMPSPAGLRFVAVVRANKDWDRSRLIGEHTESASHNDQNYHLFSPEPGTSERWALHLADARTLIFGSAAEVKAAIDTAGKAPEWEDMEFLQPDYPILTASVSGPAIPPPLTPRPNILDMPPGINGAVQGSGLILAGNEIRQVTFVRFDTAADAAGFIRSTPPFRSAMGDHSMTFAQHGRVVAVSQGGLVRLADARHGNMAAAPLMLLARLGNDSPPLDPTSLR